MKRTVFVWVLLLTVVGTMAQRGNYGKMSSVVRRLALSEHKSELRRASSATESSHRGHASLCAFVRVKGNADSLLAANGCRRLATLGDISIADIPLRRLNALSLSGSVQRIEAGMGMEPTLDSMAINTGATDIYTGVGLPQAYTGEGVVMGLMDVGFDATHPNFYNSDATETRIRSFWDQLSADTIGSQLYVGNEYTSQEAIVGYGGSRDETLIFHGTHTLGIAAGNGYDQKYRGMAPESDICLVSNAVNTDLPLIAEEDLYKYTYATDALGFKYIFDYAERVGKPCVISFSEGSRQDLHGDDLLYYEMLERLTGPGRIIVSSAGNRGHLDNYLHKERGRSSAGTCINQGGSTLGVALSSADAFTIRLVAYGTENDTLLYLTSDIVAAQDSLVEDTVVLAGKQYVVSVQAYPSCYDSQKTAYDLYVEGEDYVGVYELLSLEVLGEEADVEAFATLCNFYASSRLNGRLADADTSHGINSPSSAPCVICVGSTSYRSNFLNQAGSYTGMAAPTDNSRAYYSSIGPTYDGRTKPDVMAPGTNIFSSMGSHYLEKQATVPVEVVAFSEFQGKHYPWSGDTGTSMASPAVGGIIALWLQANPSLTPNDILGVLQRTCTRYGDASVWPNNTYGHGLINAYAGLLDVLGLAQIDGLSAHQPLGATFRVTDVGFEVVFRETVKSNFKVRIFALDGQQVASINLPKGQSRYAISAEGMKKGVVAVQLDGPTPELKGSSLLRMK